MNCISSTGTHCSLQVSYVTPLRNQQHTNAVQLRITHVFHTPHTQTWWFHLAHACVYKEITKVISPNRGVALSYSNIAISHSN